MEFKFLKNNTIITMHKVIDLTISFLKTGLALERDSNCPWTTAKFLKSYTADWAQPMPLHHETRHTCIYRISNNRQLSQAYDNYYSVRQSTLISDRSDPYKFCFYCSVTHSQVLQPKSVNKWYRGRHTVISVQFKCIFWLWKMHTLNETGLVPTAKPPKRANPQPRKGG